MVVGEASIHNIMGGMESTGGVRLHNHKRKLKQRFDIIKKLGQGTYGKVQLGINKETGQEVAIKTIKKCKIETEADLVRIRREIQIMSSVQHPNIIHIYEVFENREKMVLVMEYAAGGELYDYLSQRKVLTEEEARRIFRQIVTAVFYCHKHNICHRDLKLENILLDQIGNAKIADFGLSNVFDGKRLLNTFCGSPLYASPEIVKGIAYHGPEVDCWSLGVLLYTLVYGAMPFDGSNFKRLVKQISSSDYFEPKVPSPASTLIKDMLTICPRRRADIQKICTHWWINESYEKNCLHIAEELAAQTPVRLDLLLSLVPQSANSDKLVVGEHQADESNLTADTSSEVMMPTRSYSADNFMEFDRSNSTEVLREVAEIESRQTNNGDAKRKLDSTSSVEENMAALTKRKESSKTENDDNAPLIKPSTENAMDVDISGVSSVSTNQASDNLELMNESNEKSQSNEKIKSSTPVENEKVFEGRSIENNKELVQKQASKQTNKNYVDVIEKHVMSDSNENNKSLTSDNSCGVDSENQISESAVKHGKKLKDKSHSLDSASVSDVTKGAVKTVERRRSKIFETAEKFNQLLSNVESEKPKKIFIPGVNVGGAKRAFERKASLNSTTLPFSSKTTTPRVVKNVAVDQKAEKCADEVTLNTDDRKTEKQTSESSEESSSKKYDPNSKRNLIIQLAPNDLRPATVTVSTPVETKLSPEIKQDFQPKVVSNIESAKSSHSSPEKAKKSSKMEITLQSTSIATQPKTKKTEILVGELKSPQSPTYKTEIEAKINETDPRKMQTQRSEVAFPIAAITSQVSNSSSYEDKEKSSMGRKEQSVPIQMDLSYNLAEQKRKPSNSSSTVYSETLERQSTIDSDTDNTSKSVIGPEPIRKSPREYIIPIAVEGSNYITPRADSADIESKNSASSLSSVSLSRSRFGKSRRISSLLSDASEDDESPFLSLSRDSDDLFQRHMHRLRSSRPRRQASDLADSLSSGEEDDDDGFELLTAENLFSTLLSRVRSLTQRLNVDDNKNSIFPNSRLLGRFESNPSQSFWGARDPLSRRISESQFPRSSNCDMDRLSRKNSFGILSPKVQDNQGSLGESSKESLSSGRSNTLPRDNHHENSTAEEVGESLEYSFTPSLTRRLSNKFNQQSRIHVGASPFNSPEKNYQQALTDVFNLKKDYENENCNVSLKQSGERSLRRSTSLLEPRKELCGFNFPSLRNPESLFGIENREKLLSPRWRSGEKEYRRGFSAGRIQELPNNNSEHCNSNLESNLFTDSISACDSSTNLQDSASSRSILSCESSPANSFSNIQDHGLPYKSKTSRNFEIRLLATESLIKASKLKNLEDSKFDVNLNSKYDGNNKTSPDVISEMVNSMITKRNRSIPFPRFRSSSLNREFSVDEGKRKTATEKLAFQKFHKFERHEEESNNESKVEKGQRRISRFLRPDFFDTPREESQYVKEKEAKKALENERRKSRFMKKPVENPFETSTNISDSINNLDLIIKKEWEPPNEDHNTDCESSEKLCSTIIHQSLSSASEMEKCEPSLGDDSALFTPYIPDNTHVNEKTDTDENLFCKKSSKSVSKSKTAPRLDVPSKEEIKSDGTNMRFRSKIPTKFKKNESNTVKLKIADSNKLANKTAVDLSSLKVKKKENELSLLQRSKTEVKKSLEQCSKLVKKYSLENSKKIKAEKEVGSVKQNRTEKEKSSEKHVEKNSSRNIVQVEIVSGKMSPEKKQLSKTEKAFKEESQEPNVENVSEENGKKIVKKASILPSLSKINSSIKGNNDKGDKKLQKRTKVKEVKEKENDNSTKKKKILCAIKKADVKPSNNLNKTCEKTKQSSETASDDSKETEIATLQKLVNNTVEEKNLPKSRKSLSNKSISPLSPTNELQNDFTNNSVSTQSTSIKVKLNESKIENMKIILDSNNSQFFPLPRESKRCQSSDDLGTDHLNSFYENSQVPASRNQELSKSPDLSSNDGTEHFNLYSLCPSDCEMNNIRSEPNSSALPASSTASRDQQEQESIIDRIRRKSFYSRFNDRKRKTLVSPLSSRTDMWPSMTLPKNFSFTSSKKSDQRTHNSEKRYSLYNNILSDSKNTDRSRYSFCSDNSIPSIDSLQNNVSCTSIDVPRRKYSSTDFSLNKNHFGYSTIPRKKEINKFQMVGYNEETGAKNGESWSFSSIPSESFDSQCCSNDLTTGDNANLMQSRNKD